MRTNRVSATATANEEEDDDGGGGVASRSRDAGFRLLANLFLNPRVVHVLAEYWLRSYQPLVVNMGGPAPTAQHAGEWVATMVSRLLVPPTDLVLTGQGGMATSEVATEPRWVHRLSFVAPSLDFAMAVPITYLTRARCRALCISLQDVYRHNEHLWKRAVHGGMHGQHWFDMWTDDVPLAAVYHPTPFILALLTRFIRLLLRTLPHASHSTTGYAHLERAVSYLRAPYVDRINEPGERDMLVTYRTIVLGLTGYDRLEQALDRTRRLERVVMAELKKEYVAWRDKLDCKCHISSPHILVAVLPQGLDEK